MSLVEIARVYFTSPAVLLVLVSIYSSIGFLFLWFRAKLERPQVRSKILLAIFALAASSWIFIGSSLVLCGVMEKVYYYHQAAAVEAVLGDALLATLVIGLPASALMATKLPSLILRRLARDLLETSQASSNRMIAMANRLGLNSVALYRSPESVPFAFSLGGKKSVVVISRGLEENLDGDEMETVLVHELAHLRNKDTRLNALVTVYRTVLFFDPLIRLIGAAIHREREFACDEVSARVTRKPLALASALIKIHSGASGAKRYGVFLAGNIDLSGKSALRERIERLLQISDELTGSRAPSTGAGTFKW